VQPAPERKRELIRKLIKTLLSRHSLSIAKLYEGFGGGAREYIGAPGNRSLSDNGFYIAAVKKALKSYRKFTYFKQDPWYRTVLEHVTKEQGEQYLKIIGDESPSILEKIEEFKQNDLVGGSSTVNYSRIGKISPSTLRYIKVSSDLLNFFGEDIGERVAEIGVGYGGQLLIADKILKFKRYDLFDLSPVLDLTSRYLESHTLNSAYKTQTINQHLGNIKYDLVISNYAFSELSSGLQRAYINKVILMSKRGYMTMNSGTEISAFQVGNLSLSELRELLPDFEVLPERPSTHPGNYIIVWGHLAQYSI
jgi:putative sugar O-methyltransferase